MNRSCWLPNLWESFDIFLTYGRFFFFFFFFSRVGYFRWNCFFAGYLREYLSFLHTLLKVFPWDAARYQKEFLIRMQVDMITIGEDRVQSAIAYTFDHASRPTDW